MLRGVARVAATLAACGLLVGAPDARAQQPGWTAPQATGDVGFPGGSGLDDAGNLTVMFSPGQGQPWVARTRPAGRPGFSAPVPVAPSLSAPELGVAPSGEVVVLYQEAASVFLTPGKISYRIGPSVSELSAPRTLTDSGVLPKLAVGPGGHMAAVWRSEPNPDAAVTAAVREPGGFFGPPQVLAEQSSRSDAQRNEDGTSHSDATTPAVSIDGRGDVVAAWQRQTAEGRFFEAAYRGAGHDFSPTEGLGPAARSVSDNAISTAMGPDGTASVLAADVGGVRVQTRPPSGPFESPVGLAPNGRAALASSFEGAQAAVWSRYRDGSGDWSVGGAWTLGISVREPGAAFGAPRQILLPNAGPPEVRLDAHGNLFVLWSDGGAFGGTLRAATLSRYDLTPSQITPPLARDVFGRGLVVNGTGQAAVLFAPTSNLNDFRPRPLYLLERPADRSPPVLGVAYTAQRGGRVAVRARCSESCRIRASVAIAGRGRARASRASRSRSVVVRRSKRGRLSVVVSRSERRRLLRLLRRHRNARVTLRVRAQDGWGNPRTVRRRIPARRLTY